MDKVINMKKALQQILSKYQSVRATPIKQSFRRVNYNHFRAILSNAAGNRVRAAGCKTYLYDQNNRMLAIVKSATLNTSGCTSATEYYIRAA